MLGLVLLAILWVTICVVIAIAILRWVLRINVIVDELQNIRKAIENPESKYKLLKEETMVDIGKEGWKLCPSENRDKKIESLRAKYDEYSEKIMNSKSIVEKTELRREREKIRSEMERLNSHEG
jgi:hypothetical protein